MKLLIAKLMTCAFRQLPSLQRAAFALMVVFTLSALILVGGRVEAGTFQIAPTIGDIPPGKSTATFRITNPGAEALTVQVDANHWSQENNRDVLREADDLIVVPPLITIPPGKTQIVRIARQGSGDEHEASYRVFFHEVPAAPPKGFVGVQTALRLSVPLFFAPKEGTGKLEWRARKAPDGNLSIELMNVGSRFARFTQIQIRDGERVLGRFDGPLYALAGATRRWQIPATGQLSNGKELTVIVEMGSTHQEFALRIE